jgi:(2Fe-2S) ferredoxin
MDVDCRLDGAALCWRMLQQECRNLQRWNNTILANPVVTIESTQCLGPCGDGPNVVIVPSDHSPVGANRTTSYGRVWNEALAMHRPFSNAQSHHKSFVPADLFGANVQGVYQVRDSERAHAVVMVAADTVAPPTTRADDATAVSSPNFSNAPVRFLESRRAWYDRPRNERLVFQRVLHASILYGLAASEQPLGTTEWGIAVVLWILSNFVMKESVLEQLIQGKLGKRR